ncbi:MAG: hypothetical protein QM820_42060 [Minicystis sp.]
MPVPLRQFTAVAGRAAEFAALFNQTFASGFDGPYHYRIDLTAPAGPSTAGGKQALQHIRLVPENGAPAIVVGQVSQPDNQAEIRTFRHLAELHARRFKGARVPIDVNAYRELNRRLHAFFASQGFAVVMVDVTDAPASNYPPPMPAGGSSQAPWIIAGMAVAFAVGIGVIAFLATRPKAPAEKAKPAVTATAAPASS